MKPFLQLALPLCRDFLAVLRLRNNDDVDSFDEDGGDDDGSHKVAER